MTNNIDNETKLKLEQRVEPVANMVIEAVSAYFAIDKHIVISKDRSKPLPLIRQIVSYILTKNYNNYSSVRIGKIINRDHTTILYSVKMIENDLKINFDNRKEQLVEIQKLIQDERNERRQMEI